MEGNLNPSDDRRTIAVSESKSEQLEHRVAALESVVNFLVAELREDQQRRIKSELERLRKFSPDATATYDSWPDDPRMWQELSRVSGKFPKASNTKSSPAGRLTMGPQEDERS